MKKITFIFGTRPEAIKLAPLILAMRGQAHLQPQVCVTGQHREMLDQVMKVFGIEADVDLKLMKPNQGLGRLTVDSIRAVGEYLAEHRPDLVLVQGDTTTVFAASLAAFYERIPIGHVEAGLRTGSKYSPFPEEVNRVLTSRLADIHFAPTQTARDNLLGEGIPADRIHVTGNTVIDALFLAQQKILDRPPHIEGLPDSLQPAGAMDGACPVPPLVLITGHRRENFGAGFENICHAIRRLAERHPDVHFVYPVHLNPNVREPVGRILGGHVADVGNVHLLPPLQYLEFVAMMNRSTLVLTDSGGVQEEAPGLGKPVLVMRDTTERPEAVAMGTVKLVGTDADSIVGNVETLLSDRAEYDRMTGAVNPYGDGKACGRIIEACEQMFLSGK